jgi:hypothetical protein
MKKEEIVIGGKYTPIKKSMGCELNSCYYWYMANEIGQNYLFAIEVYADYVVLSNREDSLIGGNFYLFDDIIPYIEENYKQEPIQNKTLHQIILESLNLKKGDKVKVTHKVPNGNLGWGMAWMDNMDSAIGKIYTIKTIQPTKGVTFKEDKMYFFFPAQCLEVIERASEIINATDLKIGEVMKVTECPNLSFIGKNCIRTKNILVSLEEPYDEWIFLLCNISTQQNQKK